MCGRFALNSTSEALAADFELSAMPLLERRFNIAPTQGIVAVREDETGVRECVELRWGLIPTWTKDPRAARAPINARCETAASKPMFRQALSRRRCLIPATGFYEWQGKGGSKQPFLFYMKDKQLLAMAGLFEVWQGTSGETIESVAVLTSDANADVAPVHARMPVILARSDYGRWLRRDNQDCVSVADLMVPCPVGWLGSFAVSRKVNSPRFDDPACIEAI